MEKEKNQIEKLLDENDCSNIVLYGENNEEVEFKQIAIVPRHGRVYAILKPVTGNFGLASDEALVFEIDNTDPKGSLKIVENERIMDKVFAAYHKLLRKQK